MIRVLCSVIGFIVYVITRPLSIGIILGVGVTLAVVAR